MNTGGEGIGGSDKSNGKCKEKENNGPKETG